MRTTDTVLYSAPPRLLPLGPPLLLHASRLARESRIVVDRSRSSLDHAGWRTASLRRLAITIAMSQAHTGQSHVALHCREHHGGKWRKGREPFERHPEPPLGHKHAETEDDCE